MQSLILNYELFYLLVGFFISPLMYNICEDLVVAAFVTNIACLSVYLTLC